MYTVDSVLSCTKLLVCERKIAGNILTKAFISCSPSATDQMNHANGGMPIAIWVKQTKYYIIKSGIRILKWFTFIKLNVPLECQLHSDYCDFISGNDFKPEY